MNRNAYFLYPLSETRETFDFSYIYVVVDFCEACAVLTSKAIWEIYHSCEATGNWLKFLSKRKA